MMYKENVYTVPVLGAMGEIYSPAQIRNALQFIVDANGFFSFLFFFFLFFSFLFFLLLKSLFF